MIGICARKHQFFSVGSTRFGRRLVAQAPFGDSRRGVLGHDQRGRGVGRHLEQRTRAFERAHDVGFRRVFERMPQHRCHPAARLSEWYGRLSRTSVIFNRDKVRELRASHWACSSERAAEELGFRPAYDLERGVRETASWYREQGWL